MRSSRAREDLHPYVTSCLDYETMRRDEASDTRDKSMIEISNIISALRSTIAASNEDTEIDWDVLLSQLITVDEEQFREMVFPYLFAHRANLPDPLARLCSAAELEAARARVPFARFTLELIGEDDAVEQAVRAFASPDAAAIVGLDLHSCDLTDTGVEMLTDRIAPAALEHLDLTANMLRFDSVCRLISSDLFAELKILRLAENDIEVRGASAILRSNLSRLEHLDLSGNRLDSDMDADVGDVGMVRRVLSSLDLSRNRLYDANILRLTGGEPYLALESLNLSGNGIEARAALDLLASNACPVLRELDLSRNRIDMASRARVRAFAFERGVKVLLEEEHG